MFHLFFGNSFKVKDIMYLQYDYQIFNFKPNIQFNHSIQSINHSIQVQCHSTKTKGWEKSKRKTDLQELFLLLHKKKLENPSKKI